ncbi:hypothetical protein [Amycolatopsis keratiniphila]|uniref:hypothetical protein n=1 Tax=Amycolatopsis keratiniphila TaxID=129921 RepID=UPI0018D49D53|nr:hypothetical protein [Amycolatopsis keratiniphila]
MVALLGVAEPLRSGRPVPPHNLSAPSTKDDGPMHRVIQWSGGIGSWATAELVVRQHPDDEVTLLFAGVLIEDSDLYRFNADASERLGIPITRVCDGRTPFELFRDSRFSEMLGSRRVPVP